MTDNAKAQLVSDMKIGEIMKKYIIYGAGKMGGVAKKFAETLGYNVLAYCDKNTLLHGTCINGVEVISLVELDRLLGHTELYGVIVGSSNYDSEIYEELHTKYCNVEIIKFHELQYKYCQNMIPLMRSRVVDGYLINYNEQIKVWVDNFMSEIQFWANEQAAQTGQYHENYLKRIECAKGEFKCNRLKKSLEGNEIILDIGCGVFSQYGRNYNEKELNLIGIDPLAHFYNKINEKAQIGLNNKVKFGFFEFISSFWNGDKADVILIDNALDHCIDPYKSIIECLKIIRVGGVLSTRHRKCEAIYEGYEGLHKWNIDIDENDEFIIWNDRNKINVSKNLNEYVDFEIELNGEQDIIIVQMTLKKSLPNNFYRTVYEDKEALAYVLECIMNKFADEKLNHKFGAMLANI